MLGEKQKKYIQKEKAKEEKQENNRGKTQEKLRYDCQKV